MDVSALTRQLNASVAATVVAAAPAARALEGVAASVAGGRADVTSERAPFQTPPPSHHVDIARALAERVAANVDKPSSGGAPAPAASELWIPTWVRAAYAARARRGWFLPPPTALTGYTDEK